MGETILGIMLARDAVDKYGDALVGRTLTTIRYGAWPGGPAVVTELYNDLSAPDIVLRVKATDGNDEVVWAIRRGLLDSDEIGIFDHEEIIIHDATPATQAVGGRE